MKLTFLGTSAGTPTRERNVTSQALQFEHGGLWLLDCGEATQHQLMRAGLRAGRIERVLITHLHGDHCYGLPGLLSCIAIHGRTEPVEIAGPPGLRDLVETVLRVSEVALPYPLGITELPVTGGALAPLSGWSVSAHPLVHRIACLGYVLREDERPGRFHPDEAQRLGVSPGPLFRRLQDGHAVELPDGRTVLPEQVTDPPRPGRKAVLLGDTSDASAIIDAGRGCDLLVCETTYDRERPAKAIEWGHSTTAMTGELARRMGAKVLAITHFSSRYADEGAALSIADLVAEAQAACPQTHVVAADDLLTLAVERR